MLSVKKILFYRSEENLFQNIYDDSSRLRQLPKRTGRDHTISLRDLCGLLALISNQIAVILNFRIARVDFLLQGEQLLLERLRISSKAI